MTSWMHSSIPSSNFKRTDFAKAKDAFVEFKYGLQRHIVGRKMFVSQVGENSGMAEGGPTQVMHTEHQMIGQCLEAIHDKVQQQNPRAIRRSSGWWRSDIT